MEQFFRTELLFGKENMEALSQKHVAIFGIGGVGSFAAEAIARSGVGKLTIVDFDTVDITNINRQIPALMSTVGQSKVQAMKTRLMDINPNLKLQAIEQKYTPDNAQEFFVDKFDYVVDAIDIITSKLHLIQSCKEKNISIISSMGMGNKVDPTRIQIADLQKTHMDPLAKVMRKELKARGIIKLDVVFSDEKPRKPTQLLEIPGKRSVPASCAFVPPVAGLMMASFVIRKLVGEI